MTDRVVRVERSIPAASSVVWAVLADLPNHASWRNDVKVSRMVGDATSGVGARRHLDLAPVVAEIDAMVAPWRPILAVAARSGQIRAVMVSYFLGWSIA